MNSYADSGFLCSLYAPDAHSARAAGRMRRVALPLPLTWLHQLEVRNAMRLRVFRRELSAIQCDISLNLLLADLAAGVLAPSDPPLPQVFMEAERLSAQSSAKLGTRSLDILHVASALVLGVVTFLTFDQRQGALAKASGLKTPNL